jgi:hypothetical protein
MFGNRCSEALKPNLRRENQMAGTNPPPIPKAPASPVAVVTAASAVLSPTDVARCIDLLSNFLYYDQRIHPDDLTELNAISTRVRNSSNL